MRMPISAERRLTSQEKTAYVPTTASARASAANDISVISENRVAATDVCSRCDIVWMS